MPPFAGGWAETNQRALMAEIRRVCRLLRGEAGTDDAQPAGPAPTGSALDAVCAAYGLSAFERDILLMCVAPELDSTAPQSPSFGAALAALPGAHWSALLPSGPLRWWRLVEPGPGRLVDAALRADEWIVHVLAGAGERDERVGAAVRDVPAPDSLPPSRAAAAAALAQAWRSGVPAQLVGTAASGAAETAAAAAALNGFTLSVVSGAQVADGWLRLWQREALLGRQALLVDAAGADQRSLADAVRRTATPLALLHDAPLSWPALPLARIPVPKLSVAEQAALFEAALGERGGEIDRVAAHFDLSPAAIAAAAAAAGTPDRLWAACAGQAATPFDGGARITPRAGWDDLVLPAPQDTLLRELSAEVRHRHRVHEAWGFGASPRNRGVTALLHGPSGTGKTLAAEVVAGALGLDLFAVDLSALVSKYIGETEKNLRGAFDAAEASGAVLLFDEADALFGKRSEVRDSHDRYANMEVSYLLQRMESYRGLAVLTTNMKDAVDAAFLRRLRFVVEFPYPGPAERERIWRGAIPPAAPTDNLAYNRLAQISLAGGHIRNIALAAAFLAAGEDAPIRMDHLLRAARRECAKLERPLTAAELAGW